MNNIAISQVKNQSLGFLNSLEAALFSYSVAWCVIPIFFWCLAFFISLLIPSILTAYFPIVIFCGILFGVKWKRQGFILSYLMYAALGIISFKTMSSTHLLWQSGILTSFVLTHSIFFLSFEHQLQLNMGQNAEKKELQQCIKQLHEQLECERDQFSKDVENLREEIERIKEESEQRKIEKINSERHCELVQTEIEMLIAQKEALVSETESARRALFEKRSVFEKQQKEWEQDQNLLKLLKKEYEQLKNDVEQKLIEKRNEALCLHASLDELQKHTIEPLNARIAQLESDKETLLNENAELLNLHQQSQERINESLHCRKILEEQLTAIEQNYLKLESERAELLAHKEALVQNRESVPQQSLEEIEDLKRSHARLEGLYRQLRLQFDEKSAILSANRKELFRIQGQILASEREKALELNHEESELWDQCYKYLENQVEDIQMLKNEIMVLEELVSHILHQ